MFFKKKQKKTDDNKTITDTQLIKENLALMRQIMIDVEGNAEINARLTEIHDKYKYVSPKGNDAAISIDEQIKGQLSGMEDAAERAKKKDDYSAFDEIFTNIRKLLEQR